MQTTSYYLKENFLRFGDAGKTIYEMSPRDLSLLWQALTILIGDNKHKAISGQHYETSFKHPK